MPLNIGADAPDFAADSTAGPIAFHAWKGDRWAALFSCPFAFTPVCTTELGALARRQADFDALGVKVMVTTVDRLAECRAWCADIAALYLAQPPYPMICDSERRVGRLYGMIDADARGLLPVAPGRWLKSSPDFGYRTLFIISPDNTIALTWSYRPNLGLSFDNVLHSVRALQQAQQ